MKKQSTKIIKSIQDLQAATETKTAVLREGICKEEGWDRNCSVNTSISPVNGRKTRHIWWIGENGVVRRRISARIASLLEGVGFPIDG